MYNLLFYTILGIVLLEFGVHQWLAYLNRKAALGELPDAVKDIYNADEYARQQAYFRTNNRFGLITSSFSLLLILAMLLTGGFGWWYQVIEGFQWMLIPTTLLFFGSLYIVSEWLSLPFEIYGTFIIEERFGFNKNSPKGFVTDTVKSWGVSLVLGGIIVGILTALYQWLGQSFWIWAFGVVMLFSVLLNMFYSEWIVPLFNKQIPLEAGELRNAIEAFCNRAGFTLDTIFVIDGSRRTTKANAYFSGLGRKKRIVLYDTLIEKLTTEEIVAVLAHEIGHYKHKHTRQMMLLGALNTFILLFLFSLLSTSTELAHALGAETPSFAIALIAFSLLYTPVGMLTGWALNNLSRKNEYQADTFAASFGLGVALVSALKKLTVESLGNLTPHPAYVKMYYSHPTLLQRIDSLTELDSNV